DFEVGAEHIRRERCQRIIPRHHHDLRMTIRLRREPAPAGDEALWRYSIEITFDDRGGLIHVLRRTGYRDLSELYTGGGIVRRQQRAFPQYGDGCGYDGIKRIAAITDADAQQIGS